MATPAETAQVIRFALGGLAAQNGRHTFEHLCRHVAKRRIASNVLPATGPVSAGGDQGRDFESFRTYLVEELPFALGFLALASRDVVVFACTIQQDKLRTKFEDDIEAICTQGTHVDRIYIFATADVHVRLRHDLQAWARHRYEVGLEIIDGFALAEWLSEPDLYWIAQQYLELPAELAPQDDGPNPICPVGTSSFASIGRSRIGNRPTSATCSTCDADSGMPRRRGLHERTSTVGWP